MKATYQTPDIDVVDFEADAKIMGCGYYEGQVIDNPFPESEFL